MLVMCAFFDNMSDFTSFVYTPECVIRIAVSCFFALGVNISNYLVLGMTSPLTYQVYDIRLRIAMRSSFGWPLYALYLKLFNLRLSVQVLGHLKTVLILVLGFVVFHVSFSPRRMRLSNFSFQVLLFTMDFFCAFP